MEKTKLLFVCLGNICRSPAAENVMRHLLETRGLQDTFTLDSAGTLGAHAGNAPDSRMMAAARQRGLTLTGRARQVTPKDFAHFDWIFAMDDANHRNLQALQAQSPHSTARLVRFCDFLSQHDDREVPDPYYGGPAGFEHVLDLLEDGCATFLEQNPPTPSH